MLKIHMKQNIKGESPSIKHFNESLAFIKYSSDMDDINKKNI